MFQPKLGVSLHTVCEDLTDDVLQAIGVSRFATLEVKLRLFGGEDGSARRSALGRLVERGEIHVATVHAASDYDCDFSSPDPAVHQAAIEEASACIDLAIELGAAIIVVHASDEPIEPSERKERMEQARSGLEHLGPRCRQEGVRVAVELLPRTCLGNTAEEVLKMIEPLDGEVFGVCLDTNHLMGEYRNLAGTVRRLGKRLITLHVSDYDGVDEKHELPGTGVIDWKLFTAALQDIDYDGPFNYECKLKGQTPSERIELLEENFDWLCSGLAKAER